MNARAITPCIRVPAGWRGPNDLLHWRTAAGVEGAGTLTELPALAQPCLVLGWPAVAFVKAAVPASLHQHPQALAAALEEHLLQPPEAVFAVVAAKNGAQAVCAVVARALLRSLLEALAGRGIHPGRAVPEAWRGAAGAVVLTEAGGWAFGADRLPVLLDRWTADTPPAALALLRQLDGLAELHLHGSGDYQRPDLAAWSGALDCTVTMDADWSWSQAAANAESPDLLRFEFRSRPAFSRSTRALVKPVLLGLAVLALLELAMSAADWGRLSWRQQQLRAELGSAYQAAFPGNTPLLAPLLQGRRALGDLRHAAGEWADDDFVPLASRALPLLALLPPASLKALALEDHSLLVEADGLKALEPQLTNAAMQAGLRALLRDDGRLAITPGGEE